MSAALVSMPPAVTQDAGEGLGVRRMLGALNFIEAFERCPECMAASERAYRAAYQIARAPLDRARDAGLMRRDVNEALEAITLESLA